MWTSGQCPYLSARGCRMAAQIAQLPVETCPVTPQQCELCLGDHEPTPNGPNVIVGEIARDAVRTHQPHRLKQWAGRNAVPMQAQKPLTEADLPCLHRGDVQWEHTAGGGCCGGDPSVANVYACNLKSRDCTVFPRGAMGSDGEPAAICLSCKDRQVRAREPEKRIGYLKTPSGKDAGAAWSNRFRGAVFLVCGGPSLNQMDLSPLNQRGIMVAAVNNVAASHVRPQLWFSADEPLKFHQSIWADPAIAKFVKGDLAQRFTRTLEGEKSIPGPKASDYPNVWSYDTASRENLSPADYLTLDAPLWSKDSTVVRRSVMLPALRMLIDFGFTRINLLGCDFKMEPGLAADDTGAPGSYAFDEGKDNRACETNNNLFASVDKFMAKVRPHLEAAGIEVRNCTPGGYMNAFEREPFWLAVDTALAEFPKVESLFGYYWRAA